MKDASVRFVAKDSLGQSFLWSMRWGDAGYSCRSASLTLDEARTLHDVLAQRDEAASRRACEALSAGDPAPRRASFARLENARRFFTAGRDHDLHRCAEVMFDAIREQ